MKNVRLRRTLATCLISAILLSLSVFSIPSYALTEGDWTYTVTDGKATVTACALTGGEITIPSTLGGYPVTVLGNNLFKDKTSITGVTIPDGVTSIGIGAFQHCSALTSITIPNSVTTIGAGAFASCLGLTSIDIPDSVTSLGDSAFIGAGLTSITIPGSITRIEQLTFYSCSKLTSVTIQEGVTFIGFNAFADCDKLNSIMFPDSLTEIGRFSFTGCGLTSITFPRNLTKIDAGAFDTCPNLTSVVLPNGLTIVSKYVFDTCPNLTSITIPDSVTVIGYGLLLRCENLTTVDLGRGITSILGESFGYDNALTKVICRGNAPNIDATAFQNITPLDKVTIFYDPSTTGWPVGSNTYTSNGVTYKIAPLSALEMPSVPANLNAVGGMNKVDLTWDAATGAQSYTVMYSTAPDLSSPTTAEFTTNSASITGLLGNTTYYFAMRSNNITGSSAYSGTVSATTLADDATFTIKPPLRVEDYTAPGGTTYHLIRGLEPNGASVSTVMSTYFSITNGSWKLYTFTPATGTYTEVNQSDTVTKVGSCFKIEIYNAVNALTETYYMAILGDVTCDGLINVQDTSALKNHINGISTITNDIRYYCGDVVANTPKLINIQDTSAVKKHITGIALITQ